MGGMDGLVALVTGAGRRRGIGRAVALRLAAEGARVAVSDLCPEGFGEAHEGLAAVAREVDEAGSEGFAVCADVSAAADVESLVARVLERFGRLDVLVNNAGLAVLKPAVETTEAEFRRCLDVMVLGTFLCSREVGRHWLSSGRSGRIVNIASIHGLVGSPLQSAYCAAKFGVVGLTSALAMEWADRGITVNAVCPGITDTDMIGDLSATRAEIHGVPIDEVYGRYKSLVPAGRLAQPTEIAHAVAFLAGDGSEYVTGHCLRVDGGFLG